METVEKINVRGAINSLEVGNTLPLQRGTYIPSSVRNTAAALKIDTGKRFSVLVDNNTITVKRLS